MFDSIDLVNPAPFVITWDLGRRCNFDCSYCPAHRHDNFSPHASLESLKDTTNFIFEYINTLLPHRKDKNFCISFTGGEPTVNPNFIEFVKYLTIKKEEFKDQFNLTLDLTTNGAMGDKLATAVIEHFDHVTVSYHAEGHQSLKAQSLNRIIQFYKSGIGVKVNVMMHVLHFEECQGVCDYLEKENIKFIPRLIGENPDNNFSHLTQYTEEQKQWFKKYYGQDASAEVRPCCGGRSMRLCSNGETQDTKVIHFREFKNWHCSVNWFFLHIEQQTDLIYHHQTCQARLDGNRGPIGHISSWQTIVADLRTKLSQKELPIIVCPNKICGCGLCTPKSKNRQDLLKTLPAIVSDTSIFN